MSFNLDGPIGPQKIRVKEGDKVVVQIGFLGTYEGIVVKSDKGFTLVIKGLPEEAHNQKVPYLLLSVNGQVV